MGTHTVEAVESSQQTTYSWLNELVWEGHFASTQQAWSALRAVLHALRDRLIVDEAVQLAAEMPMVIRGMYYEGWRPSLAPSAERNLNSFLNSIRENLRGVNIDAQHAAVAVFRLLDRKISKGEISDVKGSLPREVREIWPANESAGRPA